jgi:ABC-type lipoprotein release transport system permease subunit
VDYGKVIAGLPGVGAVTPRWWGYYYDVYTDANYTLLGIADDGLDALASAHQLPASRLTQFSTLPAKMATLAPAHESAPLRLVDGDFIAPGQRGVAVIGTGVARVRGTRIGGFVSFRDKQGRMLEYEVIGLFTSPSQLLTNDLVLLPEADLKALFSLPHDRATDLLVEVYNPREVDNLIVKILERLTDTRPISRAEILRTYETLFNWRGGLLLAMALGAVAAFMILAWDKATGLSADERREIGILKAIGWETADVLELRFWEGAALALVAFLAGVTAGYGHVFYFGAELLAPVLKGWSVLFPSFALQPRLEPYTLAVLFLFTVVPYVVATIVPAWQAAVTDPDRVMRTA